MYKQNSVFILGGILLLVLSDFIAFGETYYVNGEVGHDSFSGLFSDVIFPPLDGPKRTIQVGINAASDGDTVIVAVGIYKGEGNRDLDFQGKEITVQSSDPNDPMIVEATVIDGETSLDECRDCGHTVPCERYHGFIFNDNESWDSVVDGFTIMRFCAPPEDTGDLVQNAGGAIFCNSSSPTIRNCTIINNSAHTLGEWGSGGGVFSLNSSPVIEYCSFINNEAYLWGGAICCVNGNPIIRDCVIADNFCNWGGGGIKDYGGNTFVDRCYISNNTSAYGGGINDCKQIRNCIIIDNRSFYMGGGLICTRGQYSIHGCIIQKNEVWSGYGGGIFCDDCEIVISNCLIAENNTYSEDNGFGEWIDGKGGGVSFLDTTATIRNSTIAGNYADHAGGGVHGNCEIVNSILWGNRDPNDAEVSGTPTIIFSNVRGGYPGLGNISIDPNFADVGKEDYHLKSQAGRWDPNSESWVIDDVTSPCIETGNPGTALGEEPVSIHNVRINMGAYGGTAEASKTPAGWGLLADLTNDGIVNGEDFGWQAGDWLESAEEQAGDLNRDGIIDVRDLQLLTEDWLGQTIWYE